MVNLGLDAGEFLFDVEDVLHVGGLGEEGAKTGSEGDLVLEFGGEVAMLGSDVVAGDAFVSDFSNGLESGGDGRF